MYFFHETFTFTLLFDIFHVCFWLLYKMDIWILEYSVDETVEIGFNSPVHYKKHLEQDFNDTFNFKSIVPVI